MELKAFLNVLAVTPEKVEFEDTMSVIERYYDFEPSEFSNGDISNKAGENNGSCKIFAFGELNELSQEQTLACFGKYYREDVKQHPANDDHQNIRNFIKYGWEKITFTSPALVFRA